MTNNKVKEFSTAALLMKTKKHIVLCTIWDDVRTYFTSQIDPKEKTELIVAISRFKKEVKQ